MKLRKKFTIQKDYDIIDELDYFRKRLAEVLYEKKYRTEIKNSELEFVKMNGMTTHSGENKQEAMKMFRKGIIKLKKTDSRTILVEAIVNLNYLIILSTSIGLLISVIGLAIFDFNINSAIISGLSALVIVGLVGYFMIRTNLNEIIDIGFLNINKA